MSSFGTYLIGFLVLVIGLVYGAYLLNVPSTWIGVGALVLIGLGVLMATTRTKMRDSDHAGPKGPTPPAG